MSAVCVVIVVAAGPTPARADHGAGFDLGVGFDFSVGPAFGIRGEAAPGFAPIVWGRTGLVLFHRGWALDASMLVLGARGSERGALGGTGSVRRYVPLASRDLVREQGLLRVRFAAYGAAGWTHVKLAPSAMTHVGVARIVAPDPRVGPFLSGPRVGAGIELALGMGSLWSRIGLDVGYQELRGAERGPVGGYGFAQLSFITSVGR